MSRNGRKYFGTLLGSAQVPPWVVNPTNAPDTFLDFANDRAWKKSGGIITPVSSLLTVARSSTKYVNDSTGAWSSVSANVLARSDLGALIEEGRTNSIRNNSMQGAVAGSPGTIPTNWFVSVGTTGLSQQVVGIGTESGIDYIDLRFFGTSAAASSVTVGFESGSQVAASNGQTWTGSLFAKLQAGTLTGASSPAIVMSENTAAGAFVAGAALPVATPNNTALGLQGQSAIRTFSGGGTVGAAQHSYRLNIASGAVVDVTLRIGWPQLELGASVTSPIRTTSAAVTRSSDVVTLTSPGAFGSNLSLYAQGIPQAPNSYAATQPILSADDGTLTNRNQLFRPASTGVLQAFMANGSGSNSVGTHVVTQNASHKIAAAFGANDLADAIDGQATEALASGLTAPVASQISFGKRADGGTFWNGFLSQAAIWSSQRVPNPQLQNMTV